MTPHEYCHDKAAKSGSSFYYSFMFLPAERRQAITALYAFCREVDDVVDECQDAQIARTKLDWWRTEVARVHSGEPTHPVTLALKDVVGRFNLPLEQLIEIIAKEGMIDREKLVPEATIETIGMASYDMVMVLMALEEKFGVYISVDQELTDVKTLNELLTVLERRIEEQKNAGPAEGTAPASPMAAPAPGDAANTAAAAAAAVTLADAMSAEADADDADSGNAGGSKSGTEV